MKYRLLNYIACPYCKDSGFPLKLAIFERVSYEKRSLPVEMQKPLCDLYCGYREAKVSELNEYPCEECIKYEVKEGILYCPSCLRWYPIIDEIPRILPDNYRKQEEDLKFLLLYRDKVPEEIRRHGKPFKLE
ncbi:MAG: Trm112 family protein [Ignisphaera sp.]|uniref:Trm112 family protein n=1 Tax=Ignisphaera aggregans TaxID=334771 RepID=A0A7C4NKW2_9CREN